MQKLLKKFDSLLKFGVAAILIAVPLYPKFPFINVPGTYVSIRIEDFLVFFVVLISTLLFLKDLKVKNLKEKIKSIFKNKFAVSFILFFAITLLSVLSGIFLTKTVVFHIGFLHWARRIQYMILFFVGIQVVKSIKDVKFFTKCLMIVIVFVFFFGIGQKYFGLPVITTQNSEYSKGIALRFMQGSHLISTFAGHYDLSTFLILVSPLLYTTLVSDISKKPKVLILFCMLSSLWLLSNAAARISFVAYEGAIVLTLILVKKYKFIALFLVISAIFALFSPNLVSRFTNIFDVTIKKIITSTHVQVYAQEESPTPTPIPVVEDRSTSIRLNVEWPRAIRAFEINPFLGTGFSSISLATDNDYLRVLGEAGILGFLSFITIFIRIIKKLLDEINLKSKNFKNAYLIALIATLPAIFLNSLFIDVFEASKFAMIFWLMLGFGVGLQKIKDENIKDF
ncbi:MAG: O-antigen ligase family protein [Candidatus Woesebacteria bacterium]|nr:MAG: O-antigen ligase family protein [Candidatus Woesebacteria bacterium]